MKLFIIYAFAAVFVTYVHSFKVLSNRLGRTQVKNSRIFAKLEESDDELRERLRKKMRKNLYSDKGVAYAPWVTKQIDEEAILDDLIRKEKESKGRKKTSTIDRGEIEFSEGMKWRMSNDQVDLAWVTGAESQNQGFIVEKRPSYGGDFQEIASFKEVSQLATKGPGGGRYRYTDPSTASGSWLYRVKDCDVAGMQNVIAQCFVEVQTDAESKSQTGIVIGFVALLVAAAAVGYTLDPPI